MDDSHIYFVYQVLTLPLTRGTSVDLKRKLMVIFSRASCYLLSSPFSKLH